MTRLKIVHRTAYTYNKPVLVSYNEARMTPPTEPGQTVLGSRVAVESSGATQARYADYWGTQVTTFEVHEPHERLDVVATATVDVNREQASARDGDPLGWAELAGSAVQDGFSDHLPQTRLSSPGEGAVELVAALAARPSPRAAAEEVFSRLRNEMTYMPGSTGVHTDAAQAWEQRQGVCQDLAHLAIGCLRSLGIPARYVSGYLHPQAEADPGQTVAGQSHAWLEWWDGAWHSWDPTNHKAAGDFHVVVARGRDYRDVAPLKGILSGGGGSRLEVSVDMTWLTWDSVRA